MCRPQTAVGVPLCLTPPPDIIRVEFERLATVPGLFTDEAERVAAALSALEAQIPLLRAGWEGPAADIFFADMDSDARPGLRRLVHALRHGVDVSALMLRILDDAEQAAARIDWSGGGVVRAAPADDGAVAPVHEDGRRGGGGSDVKRGGGPSSVIDRRAALESSDLAAAPDESTEASSPELIVIDRAGPFTVYEDPTTGERILQVDLNMILAAGYTEDEIRGHLVHLGLHDRTGVIFTQMHGWNRSGLIDSAFAEEAAGTDRALGGANNNIMAVSIVWNSENLAPDGDYMSRIGQSMAVFYNALASANPDAYIASAFHSLSGPAFAQMLRQARAEDPAMGAGVVDLAIIMQSIELPPIVSTLISPLVGAINFRSYDDYWEALGMTDVNTAPVTGVHIVFDPHDPAVSGATGLSSSGGVDSVGQSSQAADQLRDDRDAAADGTGRSTVTSHELNSTENSGHGTMNAEADEAVRAQYMLALELHGAPTD